MDYKANIINRDGVCIGQLYEGDRILRKESVEHLQETEVWKIEHFHKGNDEEIRKLMKELGIYEKAFLFSIATYIGYEDCCIKHINGKELDFDGLVEISGMSRGKVSEVINSLRHKDILYKGTNSKGIQYFINPWLFCKGNRINKVLRTMFKNYRIRVLNNVKWGDLK